MYPRPRIFISAVSKELKTARGIVSYNLEYLAYEPVWQDIFGTEQGDLRAMLREKIDGCQGVVQLVGKCYGFEPPVAANQIPRVSYTQYEALYARERGKKVWYLLIEDSFPHDPHRPESKELNDLQESYLRSIKSQTHVYYGVDSVLALENRILRMRDEIGRTRRNFNRWAIAVTIALILILALVALLVDQQFVIERELRKGIVQYPDVQSGILRSDPGQSAADLQQRTYQELSKRLGIDPKVLATRIPQLAKELQSAPDASTLDRASAAYIFGNYDESERLAVAAAGEALHAEPPRKEDALRAYKLAGEAAYALLHFSDALEHLRDAEKLTDRAADPVGWGSVQGKIAAVLEQQGDYPGAENTNRAAVEEEQRVLGEKNLDVLSLRSDLGVVLWHEGKNPEAEEEDRDVIRLRTEVLGPEDPDTLATRNNLSVVLFAKGDRADADLEARDVLDIVTRTLGPKAYQTLSTRHNFSTIVAGEGRYHEAETEDRNLIALEDEVIGPRSFLSLATRNSLADVLYYEKKYPEAERAFKELIDLEESTVGPEHLQTLATRNNLAGAYYREGKLPDAEAEYRKVLSLKESRFGADNSSTITAYYNLAMCLATEGNGKEAKQLAQRTVELASRFLGQDNPETQRYADFLQQMQTKFPDTAPSATPPSSSQNHTTH